MSCYGAPVCRTPHIDALAADSVRFTRAYTPCALCTPARASLLSGLYPHNHGALFNTGTLLPFDEERTGQGTELYPRRLEEQGYQLGYSGKWHAGLAPTAQSIGFQGFGPRGYGNVWNSPEYRSYLERRSLPLPQRHVEFYSSGDPIHRGDVSGWLSGSIEAAPMHFVAETALDLLRQFVQGDHPFFLTCNFWEPHAPYLPTEDYKDRYDPSDIRPWPSFKDDLAGRPLIHRKHREIISAAAAQADWETWAQVIARYYAQASMVDAEVGRLVAELKRLGRYDDTLIVFASDHGETIGIHGGAFDKGAMAYEEVYHIPFMIKLPGNAHAGETRDAFVSLLDLTDTFCQVAGTNMSRTDGRNLLPLLDDARCDWRDDFVAEFHGHRVAYAQRILWWRKLKYVLNFADVDELYDLEQDPAELRNVIWESRYAEELAEMRARLLANLQASGDTLGPQAYLFLTRPITRP